MDFAEIIADVDMWRANGVTSVDIPLPDGGMLSVEIDSYLTTLIALYSPQDVGHTEH